MRSCGDAVLESLYHYVVVRDDLPLGTLAAMIVHAAGESSPGSLPPDTHAVVLAVHDEEALLAVEARLQGASVPHVAVREPDAPWGGALMAIGLQPAPRAALRMYLSSLPLLKGESHGHRSAKAA